MNRLTNPPRTLIADDQPHVLEALRLLLKSEGYQIEAVTSPKAVLDHLESRQYDVLLMDLNYALDTTSGQEGLDLLARVQRLDSTLPVVVMTAWGSIPLAVEAMRRGARDFVEKPWENSELLTTLRHQIEERRSRRPNEIEEAVATQRGLLPRLPEVPGCRIAVTWQPAQAVSGDYLDLLDTGDGRLAFAIGDVIGKGVPAALLMSNLQAAVRLLASEMLPPSQVTARANRLVARNLGNGKFITFFYGLLDPANWRLTYTNAGHNAPILLKANGEVHRLDEGGMVLGVFANGSYSQAEIEVGPGDRLLLFTDGVSEAENTSGECFGEERLVDLLRKNAHREADAIRETILHAVTQFCGGQFQDDLTTVVLAIEAL